MNRWSGRVAVVTGAVGGIGSVVIKELIKYEITVVGLDYHKQKMQEFIEDMKKFTATKFHGIQCDLTKEENIIDSFKWIEENVGPVSILINNAVFATETPILEITAKEINKIFQTNITAPILCARESVNCMPKNNIEDGHIINVNSVAGNLPVSSFLPVSYSTSKHALRVISEGLRYELLKKNSGIKVTNLSPGRVRTTLTEKWSDKGAKLEPEEIATACIQILQTAANVLTDTAADSAINKSLNGVLQHYSWEKHEIEITFCQLKK